MGLLCCLLLLCYITFQELAVLNMPEIRAAHLLDEKAIADTVNFNVKVTNDEETIPTWISLHTGRALRKSELIVFLSLFAFRFSNF